MNDQADPNRNTPLAFFLTFTCYGTHLHGDEPGSVNSEHNDYDTPFLPPDEFIQRKNQEKMKQDPYEMDQTRRRLVKNTIRDVCEHRNGFLIALHVRTTHVHAVVHSARAPGRLLKDFKAYASQRLNDNGLDHPDRTRWTRGGSKPHLFRIDSVQSAIRYTLHKQGAPMETYLHEDLDPGTFQEYDAGTNRMLRAFLQDENVLDERGNVIVSD